VRRQCGTIPIYSNKDKCTIKTCIFHGKCNASNLRLQMLLHFFENLVKVKIDLEKKLICER
jgi:hypothetical protein